MQANVDRIRRDEADINADAVDVCALWAFKLFVTRSGVDDVDSHEALCKMSTLPKQ